MRLLLLSLLVAGCLSQYDGPSEPSHPSGYETEEKAKQKYGSGENGDGSSAVYSKPMNKLFKKIEKRMKCGGIYVSSPDDHYFAQNYQMIKTGFSEKVQQAPPQVQSDFIGSIGKIVNVASTFFSLFQTFFSAYQSFSGAFAGAGLYLDSPGADAPEWEQRLNAAINKGGNTIGAFPGVAGSPNIPAPSVPLKAASFPGINVAPAMDAPQKVAGMAIPPPPEEDGGAPEPAVKPYVPPAKPCYKGKPRKDHPSKPKSSDHYAMPPAGKPSKSYKPRPYNPSKGYHPPPPPGSYKPKPMKKPHTEGGYATGPHEYPYPQPSYPAHKPTYAAPKDAPTFEDTPYDVPQQAADAPKKKKKKPAAKKAKAKKGKVVGLKQQQNVRVKGGQVYTVVKAPRYIDLYIPADMNPQQTAAAYAAAMKAAQKDAPENPMVLPPAPPGVEMTVSGGDDNVAESPTPGEPVPPAPVSDDSGGYRRLH